MASKAEDTVKERKQHRSESKRNDSQPVSKKSDKRVSYQINNDLHADDDDMLKLLDFPGDIDWSTTLILICDPKGTPYKQFDLTLALEKAINPYKIWHLSSTALNCVFLVGLRFKYDVDRLLGVKEINVKGLKCAIKKVPTKCVDVVVRWIPPEIDSSFIIEKFQCYGKVVKTEHTRSDTPRWKHIYTNDRRFTIEMNPTVKLEDIPYSIEVKSMIGSVLIRERIPRCLECYYTGHQAKGCSEKSCKFFKSNGKERESDEGLNNRENDNDDDHDDEREDDEREDDDRDDEREDAEREDDDHSDEREDDERDDEHHKRDDNNEKV